MIGLLLALYPARWRRRYGEEFRAVLESRPLGPFDVADVVLGALDARLQATRHAGAPDPHGGRTTMLRIGGLGAIVGGLLYVSGFVGASLTGGHVAWFALLAAGTVGLLLAFTGLSAFQARRSPGLAWAAFAVPGFGSILSIIGLAGMATMPDTDAPMIGGLGAWSIWASGALATLFGSILFAVATLRASVLSPRGALGLAASSILVIIEATGFLGAADSPIAATTLIATLTAFAASWIVLGASALRRGPIRALGPG